MVESGKIHTSSHRNTYKSQHVLWIKFYLKRCYREYGNEI